MGVIAAQLIVSFGLLLLSRLLIKPPKDASGGLGEDKPTTLATRGEYLPLVFGKRRIGYIFGWAGDRRVKKEGGGGKGGGGGGSGTKVWYESGWHQLGIGPGAKLYAIYANGESIWEGPIDAATSPSGTTIDAGAEGSFTIYWGETTQPINTFLGSSSRMGISSRWPSMCYVLWQNKRLGSSPTWPQIEYVIEFGCENTSLTNSSFQIIDTESNEGVNPAYILVQLLAASYPYGVGIEGEYLDRTTIEELGVLAETEEIPMNLLIEGGNECSKIVQQILQDMGILLPQAGARLAFIANREPSGAVPVFGADVIAPPDLERSIQRGDSELTRPVFTYKDSDDDKFRDTDIAFDDDAEASELGRLSSQRIVIGTTTHMLPSSKIARRRSQESTVKSNVKIKALRGARQLVAGQVFDNAELGRLRITSTRRSDDSPLTELDCSLDTYGVPDITDIGDGGVASVVGLDVVKDIVFTYLELPTELSSEVAIAVLRIRGHEQIEGAFIHASADATTYTNIGTQDTPSTGGLLESALGRKSVV